MKHLGTLMEGDGRNSFSGWVSKAMVVTALLSIHRSVDIPSVFLKVLLSF